VTVVTVVVKRTEHLGSFLHGESPVTVVMDPVLYGSPVHDRLQAASFLSGADWFDLPEDGGGMKAAEEACPASVLTLAVRAPSVRILPLTEAIMPGRRRSSYVSELEGVLALSIHLSQPARVTRATAERRI